MTLGIILLLLAWVVVERYRRTTAAHRIDTMDSVIWEQRKWLEIYETRLGIRGNEL